MESKLLRASRLFVISLIALNLAERSALTAATTSSVTAVQEVDGLTEIDVESIPVEERVTVEGTVLNQNGDRVSGAKVVLQQMWKEGVSSTATDVDGKFSIVGQRKSLRFALVTASMGDVEQDLIGSTRLPYDDKLIGETPLEIKLAAPKYAKAVVVDADQRPLPDVKVGFMTGSFLQGLAATDKNGNAVLKIPKTVTVSTVFAISDGHGFDYRMFHPGRRFRGDKKQGKIGLPDEPVTLTLAGSAPVRIRLIDDDGAPIPEVDIYPWILRKPSENDSFNVSFLGMRSNIGVHQKTDINGEVSFNWFPKWHTDRTSFWPTLEGYVRQQQVYDRDRDGDDLTVTLRKQVLISGCVQMPDGKPCHNASVAIVGEENGMNSFRSEIKTDDAGRYAVFVDPDMLYLVVANFVSEAGEQYASGKKDGFTVRAGEPIEGMDFNLRRATRIFGTLKNWKTKEPVPNHQMRLELIVQSAKDAGIELPQRGDFNRYVQPNRSVFVSTDGKGKFEFWVGDGVFKLHAANDNEPTKIKVSGEPAFERDVLIEVAGTMVFKGQVYDGAGKEPVANAKLNIVYQSMKVNRAFSLAKTDEKGKFAFDRPLYPFTALVTNEDGTKGAIFEADTKRTGVIVRLQPTASASGVLKDRKSGLPLSRVKLSYGYRIEQGGGLSTRRFGGTARTDENGKFVLTGLIVGKECVVSMPASKRGRIRGVAIFTPEDESKLDLGEFEIEPADD